MNLSQNVQNVIMNMALVPRPLKGLNILANLQKLLKQPFEGNTTATCRQITSYLEHSI